MKKLISMVLTMALLATTVFVNDVPSTAAAKKPKLSKTSITLNQGKSKTITVKKNGTSKITKTTWKVSSGKKYVTLSKKKKTSVKVKASSSSTGTAKVKAQIRYKKKGSNKTYKLTTTLKVKVTLSYAAQCKKNVTEATTKYTSLAQLAEKYGFKLGVVMNEYQLGDDNFEKLTKYHFNSLTAGNEFKAYSLLDQSASKASKDGMPAMNYSKADDIISFAKDNGLKMRGHTLVWYAYMTDWFFREGYDTSKPYASREVMMARMQSYIEQVITHFETKYPGVIYCWDVVNEAVGDSSSEAENGDVRRLRKNNNLFYKYVGDDYVALAFKYAKDTVEKLGADIKLYYNDYNCFLPAKRDCIRELVKSVNTYEKDAIGNDRKLVDGVGMQGYIGGYGTQNGCMNEGNITDIKNAINLFAADGLEVQLTEMAVRNYENDSATMKKHADFYGKLFAMFKEVNAGENKPLKAVTTWGAFDTPDVSESSYDYKMFGTYAGLFNEKFGVKQAFKNVYNQLNS